jgi:TRAP-type C4-dicarboxylate transport system permease small subunit
MIENILRGWTRIETVLVGILLIVALAVFLGGTALRYFAPANAVDWAEEVAVYCIVWATVLSGSALIHERRHITADILVAQLPTPVSRAVGIFTLLLTLGFCLAMAWYGWQATRFALLLDERSASTLRTPMAYALFLALPVGMALMVLRLLLMLVTGTRSISAIEDETQLGDFRTDTAAGEERT